MYFTQHCILRVISHVTDGHWKNLELLCEGNQVRFSLNVGLLSSGYCHRPLFATWQVNWLKVAKFSRKCSNGNPCSCETDLAVSIVTRKADLTWRAIRWFVSCGESWRRIFRLPILGLIEIWWQDFRQLWRQQLALHQTVFDRTHCCVWLKLGGSDFEWPDTLGTSCQLTATCFSRWNDSMRKLYHQGWEFSSLLMGQTLVTKCFVLNINQTPGNHP